jgi:hypothetical protein
MCPTNDAGGLSRDALRVFAAFGGVTRPWQALFRPVGSLGLLPSGVAARPTLQTDRAASMARRTVLVATKMIAFAMRSLALAPSLILAA